MPIQDWDHNDPNCHPLHCRHRTCWCGLHSAHNELEAAPILLGHLPETTHLRLCCLYGQLWQQVDSCARLSSTRFQNWHDVVYPRPQEYT
jgi:hypothetical protein